MALVYLVRHGQSTWNVERRWAGHANPPLSTSGQEQTLVACKTLADMDFAGIVSSSLLRAQETAAIVAAQLKLPLYPPLADFDERQAGLISGLTSSEIEMRFPSLLDEWRQGNIIEIPGGESWAVFTSRVIKGFAHLENCGAQRMLLITHEGVLRAVAYYLKESHQKYGNLQGRWLESGLLNNI